MGKYNSERYIYDRMYKRSKNFEDEKKIPYFGFENFTNEEEKKKFVEASLAQNYKYFSSAIEIDTKQYCIDEKNNRIIYYPLWNSNDTRQMYKILFNKDIPFEWDEFSTHLEKESSTIFDCIKPKQITTLQEFFRNKLIELQDTILYSDFSDELKALLLPEYIRFFSKVIYYILSSMNDDSAFCHPNIEAINQFLDSENSSINRDYSNIFLAFQFYLSWVCTKRKINRDSFLLYYSNKQIEKLNRTYSSMLYKNPTESLNAIAEKRNLSPYIKNELKKQVYAIHSEDNGLINLNDSMTWEVIFDCIHNQPSGTNLPYKNKDNSIYSFETIEKNKKSGKKSPKIKTQWLENSKGQTIKRHINDYHNAIINNYPFFDRNISLEYILTYFSMCQRKFVYNNYEESQKIDNIVIKTCDKLSSFLLSYSFDSFFDASINLYNEICRLSLT